MSYRSSPESKPRTEDEALINKELSAQELWERLKKQGSEHYKTGGIEP